MWKEFTNRLVGNYELFLYAITGRYLEFRSTGAVIAPFEIKRLEIDAQRLARNFYAASADSVEDFIASVSMHGSDELLASLTVRKIVVLRLIGQMVAENVAQVLLSARSGTQGVSKLLEAHGAMGLLVQRQAGKIRFKSRDTSGRNWDSAPIFHVIARDFAYQCWIDAALDNIADSGVTDVQVAYQNATRNFVIALVDLDDSKRSEIFHPNSSALPEAYVSP